MADYRKSDFYRNDSTYPGGSTVATTTVAGVSGQFAVVQEKAKPQIRRYVFPYWEVQAEIEAERRREQEAEIAREQEIAAVEAAQEEAAAAVVTAPVDEAQLQSLVDTLVAASLEAVALRHQPVVEPVAAQPTYALPDDLYFAPIVRSSAARAAEEAEIRDAMEAIAIIEAIELQEVC